MPGRHFLRRRGCQIGIFVCPICSSSSPWDVACAFVRVVLWPKYANRVKLNLWCRTMGMNLSIEWTGRLEGLGIFLHLFFFILSFATLTDAGTSSPNAGGCQEGIRIPACSSVYRSAVCLCVRVCVRNMCVRDILCVLTGFLMIVCHLCVFLCVFRRDDAYYANEIVRLRPVYQISISLVSFFGRVVRVGISGLLMQLGSI